MELDGAPEDEGKRRGPRAPGGIVPFVIPSVAVALTALVLLGPGALRPVVGARVRGAPIDGARVVALRVEGVRSLYGIDDAVPLAALEVEAGAPGQGLGPWRGGTASDGIAEVVLTASEPVRPPLVVRMTERSDPKNVRVLAEGLIALGAPAPREVRPASIAGVSRGDFTLRVTAARGIVAAPFTEELRVAVTPAVTAEPTAKVDLELSGAGIDLAPDAKATFASTLKIATDERGAATFAVRVLAHQVELSIKAKSGEKKAIWEGTLPVVPGALWLDPAGLPGATELVSPAPRALAYVSFWGEQGRIGGQVVPLAADAKGFFRGKVDAPPAASGVLFASVAGDPSEQGIATVAWPIRPPEGLAPPQKMTLLLDGVPKAVEREQARASAARRAGLFLLGAAALAEMLLLLFRSRAAQKNLEAHFASAAVRGSREGLDDGGSPAVAPDDRAGLMAAAREVPLLTALLLAALVGLAFAMVAALATFR